MRLAAAGALLFFVSVLHAQSVDETAETLESAINDLQSALDDVEQFRGGVEQVEEMREALAALRNARQVMRMQACTLLLASADPSRAAETRRLLAAYETVCANRPKRPAGGVPSASPVRREDADAMDPRARSFAKVPMGKSDPRYRVETVDATSHYVVLTVDPPDSDVFIAGYGHLNTASGFRVALSVDGTYFTISASGYVTRQVLLRPKGTVPESRITLALARAK